jgi:hypothetical protein
MTGFDYFTSLFGGTVASFFIESVQWFAGKKGTYHSRPDGRRIPANDLLILTLSRTGAPLLSRTHTEPHKCGLLYETNTGWHSLLLTSSRLAIGGCGIYNTSNSAMRRRD